MIRLDPSFRSGIIPRVILMQMNAENIFHGSQSRLFQHVRDVLLLRLPAGVPSACCAPRVREAYDRYRAAVRRAASAAPRLPEKLSSANGL